MTGRRPGWFPVVVAIVSVSIAIFAVDLLFPLGVASGVPYVAVVLLSRWLGQPKGVVITTVAVTALTVVGFFIPFPEGPLILIGIENRLISLFAIWTTAIFAVVLIRRNEAISRERDFNKRLVETATSMILLVDQDGSIIYQNPYTIDVVGSPSALGGNWIDILVPEEEQARVRQLFASWVKGGSRQTATFLIKTGRSEVLHFSWTSQVTVADNGNTVSVLLIGQDITSTIEAQRRLVQSERLAAIGQAVASLSHEVRNELNSLQLGMHLLERQLADDVETDSLERIKAIYGRLSRMFDDIRGFAAPIQLERSTVSVAEIWRRAWSVASRNYHGKAELLEHRSTDNRLNVDPMRIEQVFRNLFDNSLAACPQNARIAINCNTLCDAEKRFLRIAVRDNGPGLSREAKERVFEPFFTTKSGGTGLGMSICKRICEAHGGDLLVGNSTEGAEFVVLLPAG